MQRDRAHNPFEAKRIAKQKYAERQVDKWCKWSWEMRGKIKSKDLIKQQDKYGIKIG